MDREIADLPVAIGLRQQGHMATVESMLRDGHLWDAIGAAINWHGPTARDWWAREVVVELADLRADLARARAITGPPCPKCGEFFRTHHRNVVNWNSRGESFIRARNPVEPTAPEDFCITVSDLLTNYPEIAKEMGITK